jgi:cyanophycin synthetase
VHSMKDSISRQLLRHAATDCGYAVSLPGDQEYFLEVAHPSGKRILFRGTMNNRNSAIGSLVARHKDLTLNFFASRGIAMPPYRLYSTTDEAVEFLRQHHTIVVKPVDGAQSKGVTVDVTDEVTLGEAVELAQGKGYNGKVILQKQLSGKLYRLIVVNGVMVAAALRRAPEVTGDGSQTVRQLIEQLNADPRRGETADTPLKKISLSSAEAYLGTRQIDTVLSAGEVLRVSALDSVSAGGEAVDVTESVHARHAELAEWVSKELDLYVCGIDIMTEDISLPPQDDHWPLLEINSQPGLKLHHFPTGGGQPRDVAGMIMKNLFSGIA